MSKISIRFYNDHEVRAIWDEELSKWWFSVVDIVGAINNEADYQKSRNYWKYLKTKLKQEGNELVSTTNQLKMTAPDGKKGLKGTFWTNTEMDGKPFTTEYYTKPLAVTTAGMHVFAANLPIEDFSARYETTFAPTEAGEYVVSVEGTGQFEVLVNGERKAFHRI